MIYNGRSEYKVKFYKNPGTGKEPALEYLKSLAKKDRTKVSKYREELRKRGGYLDEPYSRHVEGKIRELRVDFAHNRHRIFYFIFVQKTIIMLHAFLKTTPKTPPREIKKAKENHYDVLQNYNHYEK